MKKLLFFILTIFSLNTYSYKQEHLNYLAVNGSCPGCDLTNAFLQGLKLSHGNFDKANLSGANLSGATLDFATFRNATLIGTILNSCILNNSKFNKADLANAQIVNANLISADFNEASLKNTNFFLSRLIQSSFQKAKFTNTIFKRADLFHANLFGSTGNMLVDYCAGSPNCPHDYCNYYCTNFCCTIMPNGSKYSDPYSQLCLSDRKGTCSAY